jgi:hypothetical protein
MADANVSATADRTLITVVIVHLHTIGLSEGTDICSDLRGHKK